jgi:tetratricopeptide (TPR) repeat protein
MEDLTFQLRFDEAYQFYDEAICEDDESKQEMLLTKARLKMADMLVSYPENADLHHLMGLCWYRDNQDTVNAMLLAEQSFKSVLELESEHQYAKLYLGHVYFDTQRYEQALNLFAKVDADYFNERMQLWRNLKNAELILCCRMYLNLDEVILSDVEDLCALYETANSLDRTDVPVPQEILACIAKLFENHSSKLQPIAYRAMEMVRRISFENAKSLEKSLSYLRQVLAR